MKKLIVSLVLLMGLSFNVNAISPSSFISAGAIPVAFMLIAELSQAELKECDSKPYRTVSRKGTNFFFDVDECTYQENKDNYN